MPFLLPNHKYWYKTKKEFSMIIDGITDVTGTGLLDGLVESNDLNAATQDATKKQAKNLLINGAFDIWQRGTTFAGPGFNVDRWQALNAVTSVDRSTDVPADSEFEYSMRIQGNGADPYVYQKIEKGARSIRGKQVMLSFWAKADVGGFGPNQYVESNVPTYHAQTIGPYEALTSTWTRYEVPFTVSNSHAIDAEYLSIRFDFTENAPFDVYLTGIQLEEGSTASDFEHRSVGEELALCQRYYQQISTSGIGFYSMGNMENGNRLQPHIFLPTSMRTAATVTLSSVGDFGCRCTTTAVAFTSGQLNMYGNDNNHLTGELNTSSSVPGSTTGASGHFVFMNANATIKIDAEL